MIAPAVDTKRRFLFISFAAADIAAADWLAQRLRLAGYEPCLDRHGLRGGDQWSPEITRVLREETFRVLHLVSRHSLQDSYAAPERQRARDLGRERGEPMLVPLLMEPLPRGEWPIEVADLVPIPFDDWGEGLARLLEQLGQAGAPRPGPGRSSESISIGADWSAQVVAQRPEPLFSNAFLVEGLPSAVHHYRRDGPLDDAQWQRGDPARSPGPAGMQPARPRR